VTTADDNEMGRFPGAQPRGPRAGFAAEGPAAATRRSRPNERVNAPARSHPSDLSERETLISASCSVGSADSADNGYGANSADNTHGADPADKTQGADPANGERKPDVAILLGAVDLASPVRAGDPVGEITGDLAHSQTGAENVDGEPNLDAPAPRQR
jgi:hypothetical protein